MVRLTDSPNAAMNNGETPISLAIRNGHLKTARFLSSVLLSEYVENKFEMVVSAFVILVFYLLVPTLVLSVVHIIL